MDNQKPSLLEGTFRPLLSSRKEEAYAWGIVALLTVGAVITYLIAGSVPWPYWIFFGFFLFAGVLITFGNWVDRNTILSITKEGVEFSNRLRAVKLKWSDIAEVAVQTDRWGKRVQVKGRNGQHFSFRTLTKVEIHTGKEEELFGFREGDELIQAIVQRAGLIPHAETEGEVRYARGEKP